MIRNPYLNLVPINEARDRWLEIIKKECPDLEQELVPLKNSFLRVISRPIKAERSSPACHTAAMDGVAVKAAKTFTATPSSPVLLEIGKDAHWINTGNVLPKNTDAVIMVENLHQQENNGDILIEKSVFPWQHVRKMGEDIVETEIVLGAGTKIGAFELGALAAAGIHDVWVNKKPKVTIIPSGSDLVNLEAANEKDIRCGQYIPEFNSLIFSAMLEQWGAIPAVSEIVEDDPKAISQMIRKVMDSNPDLIILNAGTSAGQHDFSAEAIMEVGKIIVHGVAMMPGKPTILGLVNSESKQIPIIGAPGYPVSGCLALEEFVLPLFALWQHCVPQTRESMEVYSMYALPSKAGIEERIRVKLGTVNGKTYAIPLARGAGTVTTLSRADAIVSVPANCEGLNADQKVIASLLKPRKQIDGALLVIGSHDNTLDVLDSFLRQNYPEYSITSAHTGSLGGLLAIGRGQAHIAGTHLLDPETGVYNRAAIREQLQGTPLKLVRLVNREQGLIVKKGNPLKISSLQDIISRKARFINRQKGSGTRVLLDYELKKMGIEPDKIDGYANEEYTHMSIAAAVASDRADAGLGIKSSAVALDLDFIPVGYEEYDLVIPDCYFKSDRIEALLNIIRSQEFKNTVLKMGGYDAVKTGEVVWEYDGK